MANEGINDKCTHATKSFEVPLNCGLFYKCVTIVIDPPSVVKVTLQIVASLTIVIEDARLRLS
jgi:hypothetical protein